MKIETKYNIGDTVWVDDGGIPVNVKVLDIKIDFKFNPPFIMYCVWNIWICWFAEDEIFSSKEEVPI